ncbi:hypothetical protein [Neisseria zoodegmatis]|uniref:Uncharacterized protein n=1 Tax=Neisseria zoodegmatis TaxID=326523 RepID=A0AB38DNB5_9NEIS|nr:hypothetical protein [Neisseria zoodegmatis]OSI09372.1 hypothetical protein BWD10_09735 [Neisseria zoodegmatis]SNU78606.1 Uncharacterised protein [Neisseria zoodegmatis]
MLMQKLMKLAGQLCLAAAVFFALAIPLKFLLKIYIYSWFDIPPDSDIGVGGIHFFSAIVAFNWVFGNKNKTK